MTEKTSKKKLLKQALHLIDNWLDYQTYFKEIPGVAVGIFIEDEIVFKKEYGYANLEKKTKLTDQHLFRIASHSKLFTATAIMKLYHEEKLSIDDRISKYLPWFTSEKDENLKNIRIRHLLTHSSGMSRDGKTAHWQTYEFPGIKEIMAQVKDGISYFETSELLKYSNFGYTLLGQIIETVSGQTYHDYIRKEILEPLGMENTETDVNESNIARHATGYKIKFPRKEREQLEHVPARIMHSATGLSSTAEDLIKFYQAHIFGNDILFPDYIKREMQRIQFKSKMANWGLGFSITSLPNIEIAGHGGGYPGFITKSGIIQDQKIIVVVLTNAINGPALTLFLGINKIFDILAKEKEKLEPKSEEKNLDMKDIIGFYESDWGISLFSQIGSKLVVIGPSDDNPAEFIQIYKHKEGQKFIAPKEPPFASPGQEIEFIDGPDKEKIFVDSHGGKNKRFEFTY
ncbi:MAG: class A beta-lactamase-related serine hydrolase [Candidatus Heimdallarchaeota archaeon]|nr:MAG: class A beta-lactamase-related serine hydrolase [Candidatus Heimdallarchaeota archaeon]